MKNFLVLGSLFFLFASTLPAEEELLTQDETYLSEGPSILNSRPLSPEIRKKMEESRQKEMEEMEEMENESPLHLTGLAIPIKTHQYASFVSNETGVSYSPYHIHRIIGMPQFNMIQLEDRSEWVIDKADLPILRTWKMGDPIEITPKGFFSRSSTWTYLLTNTVAESSVHVSLFKAPVPFDRNASWVSGLDKETGHVYLKNGLEDRTVWEVASSDLYLLAQWHVEDSIIIGKNDSYFWWFSPYNNILINVNGNHFVRARVVSSIPQKGDNN